MSRWHYQVRSDTICHDPRKVLATSMLYPKRNSQVTITQFEVSWFYTHTPMNAISFIVLPFTFSIDPDPVIQQLVL